MFEDYIAEANSKLSSLFKNIPDYPVRSEFKILLYMHDTLA